MRRRGVEVIAGTIVLAASITVLPGHAAGVPHRAIRAARAAHAASADSISFTSILGDWHGRSDCVQKGTACNDEITQYRFAPAPGEPDSILLDAQKLVNGKYESMGVITFGFAPATRTWASKFRTSRAEILWTFAIARGRLVGSCVGLPELTPLRRVSATRGLDPRPGRMP